MNERTPTSPRPGAALIAGLGVAVALTAAGCGGSGGGGSSAPGTSTPAAVSSATTTASTATTEQATTTSDSGLSGKWKGTYGGAYSGTFTLHWTESGPKLAGQINLPSAGGTSDLNGTVDGSSIKFGTVGGPQITYKGSVSGDSMSGTYSTPGGGGNWSAHRA
jgi:hypothetical protein